ncbi:hypothetical protein FGO68_gene3675 [Halteria grandinella]|uniref:Dual specificity protein phosphatase n=1 Tax=Halteria grandinella TaxID=5974 RepID=A0A8J8NB45_HALGN|nr:hypothetical protein FGO68_gene3675 [Halteria grandinella]
MKAEAVLIVSDECELAFTDGSIEYKQVEIMDEEGEDVKGLFRECLLFIERVVQKEGKTILVHCAAGVSRSASVVIAYIMYSKKIPLKEAHAFVLEKRPCIKPNTDFLKQLQEFEDDLTKEGHFI